MLISKFHIINYNCNVKSLFKNVKCIKHVLNDSYCDKEFQINKSV
jgi:hypothetical protein